jgi:hypothetical protein
MELVPPECAKAKADDRTNAIAIIVFMRFPFEVPRAAWMQFPTT